MDRDDFIDRKGERKVDFLKYYGLVEKVFASDAGLSLAMFRLLFYLDSIPYFTRNDFVDGTVYYSWDKRLWNHLFQNGWLVKIKNGYRKNHDHNHYNVSLKGKQLISRTYRILCGQEELPEKCIRTRDKKNASYSDKVQKYAIKKMNESRAQDKLTNWDDLI